MDRWDQIRLIHRLVEGLAAENAIRRLGLILDALDTDDREVDYVLSGGGPLPSDFDETSDSYGETLVGAAAAVTRFLASTDVLSEEVQEILAPSVSLARERLWLLFCLERGDDELLADIIRSAFGDRRPVAEDVLALERMPQELRSELVRTIPAPPDELQSEQAPDSRDIAIEVVWRWMWLELAAHNRSDWEKASDHLESIYGQVSRDVFLDPPPRIQTFTSSSPIDVSQMLAEDPLEIARSVASWRRGPGDFMVGSRELARSLQSAIESDPVPWSKAPVEYATELREPIYIAHYLRGISKSVGAIDEDRIPALIDVIRLVDEEPWDPSVLGSSDWDYDPDWSSCRQAAVDLIEAVAKAGLPLDNHYEFAWEFLERLTVDTTEPSSILSPSDPMTLAINRSCTRAFRALLNLVSLRYRRDGAVETRVQPILEWATGLGGETGLQFRAVLTAWVPYLREVFRDWIETLETRLFDPSEPLGLESLALAIRWSRPDEQLLRSHRESVFKLIEQEAERAIDHAVIAMLREVDGYEPESVVSQLQRLGSQYISQGGEVCARLLRPADIPPEMVEVGVQFWEAALGGEANGDRLYGFGWWAEVSALEEERWRKLMLSTVKRANGSVDWAEPVAERMLNQIDEGTIEVLDLLISGAREPWERSRVAQVTLEHSEQLNALAGSAIHSALNTTLIRFGQPTLKDATDRTEST